MAPKPTIPPFMQPATPAPSNALRGALSSPWPSLRLAAERIVRRALREHATLREAAAALGMDERTLRRLRTENPELDDDAAA